MYQLWRFQSIDYYVADVNLVISWASFPATGSKGFVLELLSDNRDIFYRWSGRNESSLDILKTIANSIGIKMSEFHPGRYKDVNFDICPLIFKKKWRKPKFLWHTPYWTGKKVTFEINAECDDGKKLLYDIPIFLKTSNSSHEANHLRENKDCVLSKNGKRVVITTEGLRGSYNLEYYLGSPNSRNSDAYLIAELRANWRDSKWFIVYGLAGGFIGSLIIFILGLLVQAVKINQQFWVNIF